MSRVTRGTPSGDAYLDLQNQARHSGRPTQELLQLYVLEGFLARCSASPSVTLRDRFVLRVVFCSRPSTLVDHVAAADLTHAITEVASHRKATIRPLNDMLDR